MDHPASTPNMAQPTPPGDSLAGRRSFLHRPVGPAMIIAIIVGVIIVRGWLIEGIIVQGHSMDPTLKDRERLLVLKKHYSDKHPPKRGDIVIFPDPQEGNCVVKRIIALPGEHLAMLGPFVYINGKMLSETYAKIESVTEHQLEGIVPEGTVWALGDNRDHSADSRDYGPVKLETIRGRAVMVLWPFPPRPVPKHTIKE